MGRRRQIEGSRVLVTGASQGIGLALAVEAVRRGAQVLAVARNEALLQDLAAKAKAPIHSLHILAGDVTQPQDRQRMVEAAMERMGGLDILVNNAGIGATGHFAEVGPDRLRKIMEVNFFGMTEMIRAFLPILAKGTNPAIVNISSVAGKRGIPARSEYSASKFAMQGFSEALRAELAKDGIDVLVICPGLTQTNFSQNMLEQKAKMPMDHMRGMSADKVALAIIQSIEKGRNEVCLTAQGRSIVFMSRFFPRWADRIAARRVRGLFKDEITARRNLQGHLQS
jgi:short-subunit dehydrogenase